MLKIITQTASKKKRRLRRRKMGEWTCELFFLFGALPPNKKNNSHVRKVLLAA
jgi:hypothetical protein